MGESGRARRLTALALLATVAVGLLVAALAWWNPWRFVHLLPFRSVAAVVAVTATTFTILSLVCFVGLRRGQTRTTTGVLSLAAAIVAVVAWLPLTFVADTEYHAIDPARVVAHSSDGRFVIVTTTYRSSYDSDYRFDDFRIRSRTGAWSRESTESAARIWHGYPIPDVDVQAVRFIGENGIELQTSDGLTWRTTFDRRTLAPAHTLTGCGEENRLCLNPQ